MDEVEDPDREITVIDAQKIRSAAAVGEEVALPEALPHNASRIAAQTAKQVVLQRLREAERELLYEEFAQQLFDAFSATKELLAKEGIFAGVSSGSVVHAAIRQAERMDQGNLVCLLADGGWKYLSTALWTKDYQLLAQESKGKIWW